MPIIPSEFRCPKCGETKSASEFYKNKSRWCGVTCWCKRCHLDDQAKRHSKNPEKYRNQRINDPRMNMLTGAKRRAMLKGIEFSITINDIVVPAVCPVLGIPLVVNENSAKENSPTLDRVDVSKGYVAGNIFVISARANRLKNDASLDEMRAVIAYAEQIMRGMVCQ